MRIDRIEPSYWFNNLNENNLQLLIYGEGLDCANVHTTIPHGTISIVGGLEGKYLIVNLSLRNHIKAGLYDITVVSAIEKVGISYEIRNRNSRNGQNKPAITNEDVVYMLMPDRFAKGGMSSQNLQTKNEPNKRHGGNIRGIITNLSYLRDLGITSLWLTPVFKNSEYHGYSITDFYDVEPCIGTLEDYKTLVRLAHENGIKIVMDVVFNHCSIEHTWVKNPPLNDWFNGQNGKKIRTTNYLVTTIFDPYASQVDKDNTVKGWFTEKMPDLNITNEFVFRYLTQMTIWWIETTGIDAIRMDTYLYSDFDRMIEWQNIISKEYPGFSVIAETWIPEAAYTAKIQNEAYKKLCESASFIVMDFAFQKRVEACYDTTNLYDKDAQIYNHFLYDYLYSEPEKALAFLDNHDLPRWLSHVKSKGKLKQALAVLLTVPRIPQIYYGTEFLFKGDGNGKGDGNYRMDAFDALSTPDKFTANEIAIFLRTVLNWRKASQAISCGSMKHFIPQNGVYVFFRTYKEEKVMVLVNNTSKVSIVDMSLYQEELQGYKWGTDVITKRGISLGGLLSVQKNGVLILELIRN